jgi:two-component system invasion response regulator UvrY
MRRKFQALLVDDHAVVRAGCRLLLSQQDDIGLMEATTGEEGLKLALDCRPDLVILDLGLRDMGGFDILNRLRAETPESRVLIFTMYEDAVFALRAIEAGATGYVTKSEGPDILLAAIRAVLDGKIYLSHAMAQRAALLNIRAGDDPFRNLTSREIDVFRLLGSGKSASEIASSLNLSYRTVANAISHIKRKLNISTTGKLLHLAIEHSRPRG